jgi:beta-1,4-mannooligosaccharide/beta-1,4-mannosyl-N-acetylglucosamine phosphorylase
MGKKTEKIPGTNLKMVGDLKTPDFVRRYEGNPVLTASMMPYPSSLVFNASVVEFDGKLLMLYRNEYYPEHGVPEGKIAHMGIAESDDGLQWTPREKWIELNHGIVQNDAYDPRAVRIGDRYYITLCQSTRFGPQAATLVTDDFATFELFDVAPPCSRNFTLFPEKIAGKYWRLERPFWQAVDSYLHKSATWISRPYSIWIASSPDMIHWGEYKPILETEMVDYANIKVGPGGAPIRTEKGWLLLTHGVDFDPSRGKNGWQEAWRNRYHGGVALLDLEDPSRVIGYSEAPFITPEAPYECEDGWRNEVIFPMTGLLRENGEIYIYYGAADTHTCLAVCRLDDLLAFCLEGR